MTSIYQSPFLIALGWTIAASIWQSALLWLLYQIMCSVHRTASPGRKHFIASLLLLASFGWFSLTLANKYSEIVRLNEYLSRLTENTNAAFQVYSPDTLLSYNGLTDFANQYLPFISAAYLIVLLLLSVKLINAYLHSKQLKTKGLLQIDEHWIELVNNYARKIGIVKKVHIHLSRHISVPATLNFFKPVILLPLAVFNNLSSQQVESIILHELAHIKRNDYLINIIASVIETILFFNPFVHLLGKTLKKEREHCCDDFVLRHRFDPHSYASALLSLEQLRMGVQPLAIAATGKNSRQLLRRIKRIMNVTTTNFNYGQKLLTLVLMAFVMISVAWLSPSRNNVTSGAEDVYNDEAELKEKPFGTSPNINETQTARVQKSKKNTSGDKSNKNKKVDVPIYKKQNDFPVLADGTMPLPPTPPPPYPVSEDRSGIIVPPAPPLNQDLSLKLFDNLSLYAPQNVTDDDTKWSTPKWLNVYSELNEQLNNKTSLNELALFIDAAKIKVLQNQLMTRERLQAILKHLSEIQLHYENTIENQQSKPIALEKKANNRSNKDYTSESKDQFLFFKQLKAILPDRRKIFTEEELKSDSLRKVSAEMAERQKEIWLERSKEEGDADEKNSKPLYELIVRVDNHINFHPAISGDFQKNIEVVTNAEKELAENRTRRNRHSGNRAFTFTIVPPDNSKGNNQKPAHRSINIRKNQTQVISL